MLALDVHPQQALSARSNTARMSISRPRRFGHRQCFSEQKTFFLQYAPLVRSARTLTLFSGSTVPCPYYVRNYYLMEKGLPHPSATRCNMLPTGSYVFRVGTHDSGAIDPALRMSEFHHPDRDAKACVWRTTNDLTYGVLDTLDEPDEVYDNVHCSYFENYNSDYDSHFSSAGCLTVRGRKSPTAQWKKFQAVLNALGKGTRTDLVMVTGKEAALAAQLRRDGQAGDATMVGPRIGRLRVGSRGAGVKKIQQGLGIAQSGYFGPETAYAFHQWQVKNGHAADGIYTPTLEVATGWGAL
jgi:hypothetical protein